MKRRRSTRPKMSQKAKKKEMLQVTLRLDQSEENVNDDYKKDYNTVNTTQPYNTLKKETKKQYFNMHTERKTTATSALNSSFLLSKKQSEPTLAIADSFAENAYNDTNMSQIAMIQPRISRNFNIPTRNNVTAYSQMNISQDQKSQDSRKSQLTVSHKILYRDTFTHVSESLIKPVKTEEMIQQPENDEELKSNIQKVCNFKKTQIEFAKEKDEFQQKVQYMREQQSPRDSARLRVRKKIPAKPDDNDKKSRKNNIYKQDTEPNKPNTLKFNRQESHKSMTPFFDIKKKPSERSLSILSRNRTLQKIKNINDDARSSNMSAYGCKLANKRTSIINISQNPSEQPYKFSETPPKIKNSQKEEQLYVSKSVLNIYIDDSVSDGRPIPVAHQSKSPFDERKSELRKRAQIMKKKNKIKMQQLQLQT